MQVVILDVHQIHDSRVLRHIRHCCESGYDVFRIRIDGDAHFANVKFTIDNSIPCYSIGSYVLKYNSVNTCLFTALWSITRYININKICGKIGVNFNSETIIHVHDPILLPLSVKLSKYFRTCKIVYDRHEVYESAKPFTLSYPPYIYRLAEIFTKNQIDGIVTVLDEYIEPLKVMFPKSTIVSVPNYPDITQEYDDIILNKISNIQKTESISFIYVGSLDWSNDRDLSLIIYIADSLLSENKSIKFIIGGNTKDAKLLNEFSRLSNKYLNRFIYRGYMDHDDVMRETAKSTFGLLLIKPDTNYWILSSPNKVYEYLVSGVIPILRINCADSDILQSCSLIFKRDDSNEFILKKIIECLSNQKLMNELSLNSYNLGKKYSFNNVSKRYDSLYSRLLT